MLKFLMILGLLTLTACGATNVAGPSCNASSTSSVGGSGNADGVDAGADASSTAGCSGGSIARD